MELRHKTSSKINRMEIFRFLWWIPLTIIISVWSVWLCILFLVLVIQILLSGKREKKAMKGILDFFQYEWQWTLYTLWLDDTRPEWNPFVFLDKK